MRVPITSLLVAAALGLAGCGGGAGGAPAGPITLTLQSTEALNGSVEKGGYKTPSYVAVGDGHASGQYLAWRSFLSFDLAPLPQGATVISAILTIHQKAVGGTPFTTLGALLLDQVVYGGVLDGGAYNRSYPSWQGVTLSTDATLGPKTVDVTRQVQDDVTGNRAQSQYRIRFPVENDGNLQRDVVDLGGPGSNSTPDQFPTLVVAYRR